MQLPLGVSSLTIPTVNPIATLQGLTEAVAAELIDQSDADAATPLLVSLALGSTGNVNGVAAMLGGIVGQEVIKACSGKYTPLQQWIHLESAACLPRLWSKAEGPPVSAEDAAPRGCRYDGQIAVLGWRFQQLLSEAQLFLVGAGALGCELMKNLAMSGMCTAADGKLVVTDMDSIEVSNLNRQFLFRPRDVRKNKSTCAAAAATVMNPQLVPNALTIKVAPDTEATYTDAFWSKQDAVINALDNVQARQYVDSRCVFFGKPLFESGTLGLQSNVQPIIPGVTESYNDEPEQAEESIALCTLKQYPNKIEHTIQWARDIFEKEFVQEAVKLAEYLATGETFLTKLRRGDNYVADLAAVVATWESRPTSVADCIALARRRFENVFSDNIKQLLHTFPANHLDKDGSLFWTGHRKLPTPATYNPTNPEHIAFIWATSQLYANVYLVDGGSLDAEAGGGLEVGAGDGASHNGKSAATDHDVSSPEAAAQLAATVKVTAFVPSDAKIAANEAERKAMEEAEKQEAAAGDASGAGPVESAEDTWDELVGKLPVVGTLGSWRPIGEDFEKDDDARCAFSDRNLHSRMPLDPTHVLKRTCV
jgi:ubiquitin-activating enzyme E1